MCWASPFPAPTGFNAGRISSFAEVPEFVFSLGEISAMNEITGHDKEFPVAVDVMAAKGCDGLIFRLAQDLVKEGVLTPPRTGRTLSGGETLIDGPAWFTMTFAFYYRISEYLLTHSPCLSSDVLHGNVLSRAR